MKDIVKELAKIPERVLLDTCVLCKIHDEGGYIFDGGEPNDFIDEEINPNLVALKYILQVDQRACFQFVVSPITMLEMLNEQSSGRAWARLQWTLDLFDHWLFQLWEIKDRKREGGSFRHRFKFDKELQDFEAELMKISDFRRDPLDRLLVMQCRMGACEAFMTVDKNTIWKHRDRLSELGVNVITPSEFWEILKPWAAIWY